MAATYSSLVGVALGGKYEIRRVLGAGGMGVVCEAVHRDLGKRVAVKLIDKTMKESEIIVARFRREARAAGQIESEHIVDVFDVGADPRVGLYMVMEHLTGEDLQGRLERDKRLDVETGVMIAHQIASGLAKAHEAGVIHRDLKPANVYLTQRDSGHLLVKLLDFGVSKLLGDEPGGARITGRGAPIGTPLYMSPEQAEGKDDVDGRADIWSLGALLYEALSGMPPFADRGSYHGTIVGILTSRPKPLHEAASWVPPALAKVVDAMLVHDRAARLSSAASVRKCLVEAFPAVLPDGTGKHTAVIVQGATATVDVTGDTEVFTAAALKGATQPLRASPPAAPGVTTTRLGDREQPPDTVSDAHGASGAGAPGELHDRLGSGPRTVRLPPTPARSSSQELTSAPLAAAEGSDPSAARRALPSSSAGGISLPTTPPILEPLPPSEVAPPTVRDDVLALRAERRRRMRHASVGLLVVGIAAGAFFVGRRATPSAPPTAAPSPPSALATEAPTSATSAPSDVAPPTPIDALPDAAIEGTPAESATSAPPRQQPSSP